eukprot:jgi/Chlat1/1277/Chrsp117S01710
MAAAAATATALSSSASLASLLPTPSRRQPLQPQTQQQQKQVLQRGVNVVLSASSSSPSSSSSSTSSSSSAAEPAWKQKLAAADAVAEDIRRQAREVEEAYKRRRRQQGGGGASSAPSLSSLPLLDYVGDDGLVIDHSQEGAKASVYAVYDQAQSLRYVGVTRGIHSAMRLHLARRPAECWHVRVHHLARPSRDALEAVRDAWVKGEEGNTTTPPPGNDNGPTQLAWENPIDVKPIMTPQERESVESVAGPAQAKALKQVARRVEAELEKVFKERGIQENMRFDPKLKEKGLLDLKNLRPVPDASVPAEKPKSQAAAK